MLPSLRHIAKKTREVTASIGSGRLSRQILEVDVKIVSDLIRTGKIDMPRYGSEMSAGLDLRACIEEPILLHPGETAMVPTGLAIWIKDPNWVGLLTPRSGLGAKHGFVLGNGMGVIDADYQGQWFMSICNRNHHRDIKVIPNERVAQVLFLPCAEAKFNMVESFEEDSGRGEGGYGSTGRL